MELLLSSPYDYLDHFLLVFVRVMGFIVIVPFLSNRTIPVIVKIVFSFFLSLIMVNVIPVEMSYSSAYPVEFAVIALKEFFTGWLIGFSIHIVFSIITLAGQLIDYQIGFSMVNVYDPLSQTQITITGNLYYFLLILMFLVTRSYYYLIHGLKDSFSLIPIGELGINRLLYDSFSKVMTDYFLVAMQIAAPIFFVVLMTNIVLGVLARTVPQLNMFVIGFPLNILFGLSVLFLTLYLFHTVSEILMEYYIDFMYEIMKGMGV